MNFLLDTDTCSAHLKRPAGLMHRFIQHTGGLCVCTLVLGELYAWAYRRDNQATLISKIEGDLLTDVVLLDYDWQCSIQFGRLRGLLLRQGRPVSRLDLMIAAVALAHNLTLVTHNTTDFQHIPDLRLADWLTS